MSQLNQNKIENVHASKFFFNNLRDILIADDDIFNHEALDQVFAQMGKKLVI